MEILTLAAKIENYFENFGWLIVFFSSLIEITPFGWTIPGGLILAIAGFFAYNETNTLISILISGWLGAWLSLIFGYLLGKHTGLWLVKKIRQEKNAQMAKRMLKRNGPVILTSSMLANLTRFWSAYIAGVEKYHFYRFLVYSGAASFTWTSLMILIGFLAGSERDQIENLLSKAGFVSWFLLIIALIIIFISIHLERKEYQDEDHQN